MSNLVVWLSSQAASTGGSKMTRMMNQAQAYSKAKAIGDRYPPESRKGWEARKAFAKECGININVFNKGLGPLLDRLVGLVKGIAETNEYVQLDERSFKSLRSEKAKLDGIVNGYIKITKPNVDNRGYALTNDAPGVGWE